MKFLPSLIALSFLNEALAESSRVDCDAGDHYRCDLYDGEGACCATIEVTSWGSSGTNEPIGSEYNRCYGIDDIISAISNDYILIDTSQGGNGNTYDFRCSKAAGRKGDEVESAGYITLGVSALIGFSVLYV